MKGKVYNSLLLVNLVKLQSKSSLDGDKISLAGCHYILGVLF